MQPPTQFCQNCGSPLGQGDSFCEACGQPVKGPAKIAPAQPLQKAYSQPAQPPPPPAAHYQPLPPPPPVYYPATPRRLPAKKTKTWLIVGGVVVALMVCCGLAALAGGLGFLSQLSTASQNQAPAVVAVETAAPPVSQNTKAPAVVAQSTPTSEPAPNEPQATPALPAPQGQRLEFTDDLSTNDNGWETSGGDTAPRQGYLPSVYYIETPKEIGEVRAWIPKIHDDQYLIKDFEVDFDGLQYSGDGYLGLDFRYHDTNDFYQVAIKDGAFLIRKKISGQFINLSQGAWVRSNSIAESGPNHIKVICHGDVIRLEVNNDLMAQIKDDSLPDGYVVLASGVLPEAPEGTVAQARFANFHVVWWK